MKEIHEGLRFRVMPGERGSSTKKCPPKVELRNVYFWNSPTPKALRGIKTIQYFNFKKITMIHLFLELLDYKGVMRSKHNAIFNF
jgi:hypothetical protein